MPIELRYSWFSSKSISVLPIYILSIKGKALICILAFQRKVLLYLKLRIFIVIIYGDSLKG